MKIKLEELLKMVEALSSLVKRDFKGTTSYKLARLSRKIFSEYQTLENERMKLVEKYGLKGPDGEIVQKDGHYQFENKEAFEAEFEEIFRHEIFINIEPLSVDDFADSEVSPSELIGLGRLLKAD